MNIDTFTLEDRRNILGQAIMRHLVQISGHINGRHSVLPGWKLANAEEIEKLLWSITAGVMYGDLIDPKSQPRQIKHLTVIK
ncbi:MAG: hypothetical protein HYX63_16630 [Gammaproteobacteria bacterium]|nr:hypothetical protein [Gammaproteobacteria bacterium]